MVGSRVPSSSMRLRTTSIDWLTMSSFCLLQVDIGHLHLRACPKTARSVVFMLPRRKNPPLIGGLRVAESLALPRYAPGSATCTETETALLRQFGERERHMRPAQRTADIAPQGLDPVLLHLVELNFEQQIGTALKIEAQADRSDCPTRPAGGCAHSAGSALGSATECRRSG